MPNLRLPLAIVGAICLWSAVTSRGEGMKVVTSRGDRMIANYFASETQKLANASLAEVKSWDDFEARRKQYRQELREMLGLDPLPERTPLRPVVTGKLEHPEFTVEKVHFQSRPALYVTGNLYVPKNLSEKVPAILYLCGHSKVVKGGVSLGNKTGYQHHGAWYARNGYVCLVIDTIQLGEIEGIHHGTYREGMWWWNARGYTPAGVETWNAIRALDYLETRPEVDGERLGVTGRSGGGAYSWFLTALDDRIKAAVPVAGITNLKNHVVDGCVEGHCDCMYFVNTYRWDFDKLAALTAPRPLLISNTDQDRIFPLDGVVDIYNKTRRVYELANARNRIGLQIAYGPHKDLQVLQVHAFQWFNHHLQGDDRPIAMLAEDFFKPEELKVFETLPTDEINTHVHEVFVPAADEPEVPTTAAEWQKLRDAWMKSLREKCFAGWPNEIEEASRSPELRPAFDVEAKGLRFCAYDFDSQEDVTLRLYLALPARHASEKLRAIALRPLDEQDWLSFLAAMRVDFTEQLKDEAAANASEQEYAPLRQIPQSGVGVAFVAPRGIGPTACNTESIRQIHRQRRYMLLGQTLDGMRVWDVRRALQALREIEEVKEVPLSFIADREMSGIALYAALFEPNIAGIELRGLPSTHRVGPNFLNVLRFLDVPQAVAMAAERSHVRIHEVDAKDWQYPRAIVQQLGWPQRLELEERDSNKSE